MRRVRVVELLFLATCFSVTFEKLHWNLAGAVSLADILTIRQNVERALFRHTSMDEVPGGARNAGKALPSYYVSKTVPVWDESIRWKWKLEVGGMVAKPVTLSLEDLMHLPRVANRVNH